MKPLVFRIVASVALALGLGAPLPAPGADPVTTAPEDLLVRRALTACYSGDRRGMAEAHQQALAREARLKDGRALRTSEAINYLFNNTLADREKFLLGHELALQETRSEDLRSAILWSLLGDEYYELALLKGENRFNKFTRIFNRASSAVSRVALLQPQAAAQLLLEGVHGARKGRLPTDRERRMFYLGRAFLEKYPQAPEGAEVQELLNQLRGKLDTDRARKDKTAGLSLLESGKPALAEFHLERAAVMAPGDEETLRALAEARGDLSEAEGVAALLVSVTDFERGLPPEEQEALEQACRALLRADGGTLATIGNRWDTLHDSAAYALASLSERNGYHHEALHRFDNLARALPTTPGGRAAAAVLATFTYNLEAAYEDALSTLRKRRRDFVLTGDRTGEDTAFAATDAALQMGGSGQALVGLPALFFTDVVVRGVAERFRSQIAADEAIDAGARLLQRHPDSPRAREVAAEMASLAKGNGDLQRVEEYRETAGETGVRQDPALREEKARALFKDAMEAGDYVRRKLLLAELRRNYPECRITTTAEKEWQKLPPTLEAGSVVLTHEMLQLDAALAASLGIPATWIDGKKSNGEVAREGIAITRDGSRASCRLHDQEQFYEVGIPPPRREALLASARQLRTSYERREAGKQKGRHKWLPLSIEGGAGSGGVEIAPKVQPYPDDPSRQKYFR